MEIVFALLSGVFIGLGILCGMYAAFAVNNLFLIPCVILITLGCFGILMINNSIY